MDNVIIDIETECMSAPVMADWQTGFFTTAAGFKPGEMTILGAGRQSGKSYYHQFMQNYLAEVNMPAYKQMDKATVDSEKWVTVKCNYETAAWVREQKQKYWYEHNTLTIGSMFDIHEKLYTMLKIKFTP